MDKLNPKKLAFSTHCFQNTPPSPVWLSPHPNDMLKSDSFTLVNKSSPSHQLLSQNVTPESQISRISYNYSNSQQPTSTYNKPDHLQKNKAEQNRFQYNSHFNYYKSANDKWSSYSKQFLKKPLQHLIHVFSSVAQERIYNAFILIKKSSTASNTQKLKKISYQHSPFANQYNQNQELSQVFPLEISSNQPSLNKRRENSPIRKICGIELISKNQKQTLKNRNKVKSNQNKISDSKQDVPISENINLHFLPQLHKNTSVKSIKLNQPSYQQQFEPAIATNVSLPQQKQRFNEQILLQDEETRDKCLDQAISNFNQIYPFKRQLVKLGGFIGTKKQGKQKRNNQPEQMKPNPIVQIKMNHVAPSLQMDYQIPQQHKKKITGTSTPQQLTSIPRQRVIFNQNSMNNILSPKQSHLGLKNQPQIIRFTANPEAPRTRNHINMQDVHINSIKTNQSSQNHIQFKPQHFVQTPKNITPQKSINLSNSSKHSYKAINSPHKVITHIPNNRMQYQNIQSHYQVIPQQQQPQINHFKVQRPIRIEQLQQPQQPQQQHPRYKSLYNLQRPSSYSHQNIPLTREIIRPPPNIKPNYQGYQNNNIYMLPPNQMHKSVSERQIFNRPPPHFIKPVRPNSYRPLSVDQRIGNGVVMRQRTPDRQLWLRREGKIGHQSQTLLLDYGIA